MKWGALSFAWVGPIGRLWLLVEPEDRLYLNEMLAEVLNAISDKVQTFLEEQEIQCIKKLFKATDWKTGLETIK